MQQCALSGEQYPDKEGMQWKDLRPGVQNFLKTVKADWKDDYFVSYTALNEILRAYLAQLAEQDAKANKSLTARVQTHYDNDKELQPINPDIEEASMSFGERLADRIAEFGGSWNFIIIFGCFIIVWMGINVYFLGKKSFDPYPFILLNLILSCLAAMQAPVIMMSQNRQEDKDRKRAEYDFKVNLKAETEIRLLHEKIDHILQHQHKSIAELLQVQADMLQMMQQRVENLSKQNGDRNGTADKTLQ